MSNEARSSSFQKEPEQFGVTVLLIPQQGDLLPVHTVFTTVFPEDAQHFPLRLFQRRVAESTDSVRKVQFFLAQDGDRPVGMRWIRYLEDGSRKIAFSPYGGVLDTYRNKNVYPHLLETSEAFLIEKGIDIVVGEFENPEKIPGEREEEVVKKRFAERRLGFFQRNGYYLLDPNEVEYICPVLGADQSTIDTHLVLGIKIINNKDRYISQNGDRLTIEKDQLREIYLNHMQLYTNSDSREDLHRYASVQKFLAELSRYPAKSVPLLGKII